jgi:phosphinothricin acetyltransferase
MTQNSEITSGQPDQSVHSDQSAQTGLSMRLANPDDAQAILAVYAPYITNSTLTFETTVPSVPEYRERISSITQRYPWLVVTSGNQVVGYAYASESRSREAYRWNAELSIYLNENYHRRGIATALYTALLQILRSLGFVNLYAVISQPNEASIALHRHFGFIEVGVFDKTGYKFDQWHDVIWMHHRIKDAYDPATHGLPTIIGELNRNDLDTTLRLATAMLKNTV